MGKVVIFGGTSEGRRLAQYCDENRIRAAVSVVSEYGQELLPGSRWVQVRVGRLDRDQMAAWLEETKPELVVDATHPYAELVSTYARENCEKMGIPYLRLLRENGGVRAEHSETGAAGAAGPVVRVESPEEAARRLSGTQGNILLTTGSKDLSCFTQIPEYEKRLYPRVLPDAASLEHCLQLKIPRSHVIAMQGPFSEELNRAMLRQIGASYLVTKESGTAGGFAEKLKAAADCGTEVLVIGRPAPEQGETMEQVMSRLELLKGEPGPGGKEPGAEDGCPEVLSLIGAGMGGAGQLTVQAVGILKKADVVLGAPRLLESVRELTGETPAFPVYLGGEILEFLRDTKYRRAAVIYSGDTGYYSGAAGLLKKLKETSWKDRCRVEVVPGISSLSYLCARLQTSWQDVYSVTMHGREENLLAALEEHDRVFVLLGGEEPVRGLCRLLKEQGLGRISMTVGEHLSYERERIVRGTPDQLEAESFDSLSAVLLEKKEVDR